MGEKPPKEAPDFTSGHRKRMYENLCQNGSESHSLQEFLEMLSYFNFRRRDMKPLVKSLYGCFETLEHILHAPTEELMEVPGIGSNTADMFALTRALFYRLG